jgi:hypothetical protein
MKLMFYEL